MTYGDGGGCFCFVFSNGFSQKVLQPFHMGEMFGSAKVGIPDVWKVPILATVTPGYRVVS